MTDKVTTPPLTGAELDKLEALARAAEVNGWDFHGPSFAKIASPSLILGLIAQARAQQAGAAPAGYKLVPLEPTPEMQQAGFDTPGAHGYNASYRAMVNAAPVAAVASSDAKGKADAANAGGQAVTSIYATGGIEDIADELEAEALNYEGDFADTVKGCVEALREIVATSATDAKDAEPETPSAKQEKLLALADRIDHEKLWRLAGMDHDKLTADQKDRMLAGIMLRRYADIWKSGHWVVVPPTGSIQFGASTLDKAVEMAKRDEDRRAAQQAQPSVKGGDV